MRYQKNTVINFGNSVDTANNQVQRGLAQTQAIGRQVQAAGVGLLQKVVKKKGQADGLKAGQSDNPSLITGPGSMTTYGEQYNQFAVASYGATIALDAREAITGFEAEAGTSQEFGQSVGAWVKGTLEGLQDPALQQLVRSKASQYSSPVYNAMVKAEQKRALEKQAIILRRGLELLSTDSVHLWGNVETAEDEDLADTAQHQFFSVLNAGVNSTDPLTRIDPKVADQLVIDYNADKAAALLTGSAFTNAIESGKGWDYVQEVRNLNPSKHALTTEQHATLVKNMDIQLKNYLTYLDRESDAEDAIHIKNQSGNFIEYVLGNDLSDENIDKALDSGGITYNQYSSLKKILAEGEADNDDLAVAEIYIDLFTKGPEGIQDRAFKLAEEGRINASTLNQLLSALDSGPGDDFDKRVGFSRAIGIVNEYFTPKNMYGAYGSADESKESATIKMDFIMRVIDNPTIAPIKIAYAMMEEDNLKIKFTKPVFYDSNLVTAKANQDKSWEARGLDPSSTNNKQKYNSEWDDIVAYDNEVKRVEALEAARAKNGK